MEFAAVLIALLNIIGAVCAMPVMAQTLPDAGNSVTQSEADGTVGRINENAGVSLDSIAQWSDGLNVGKTASDNGDGSFRLTMEALVTGRNAYKVQPVDVLMVLDLSGSLRFAYPSGAKTTRLDALKTSVRSFVTQLGEINRGMDESLISRVAMFGFSGPPDIGAKDIESSYLYDIRDYTTLTQSGIEDLQSVADGLKYYQGKTNTGAAMDKAVSILEQNADSGRKQIVVVFTDGYPNIIEGIQVSVANRAIAAARKIKESGAELYVVSIEPNTVSDPQTIPQLVRVSGDDAGNASFCYMADELQEPGYTKAPKSNISNDDLHANGNYFLYLLSGDNPHAADLFTPNAEDPSDSGQIRAANGVNYVLTAADTEGLQQVFERIAYEVGTSDADLGASAQLRDYVTLPFLIRDPSAVQVFRSDRIRRDDGTFCWSDRVNITDSVTVQAGEDRVIVSGYDYASHYISDTGHADDAGNFGSKLTVEFDIIPKKTFGGNRIPTNISSEGSKGTASGIYRDADAVTPEALFPVPEADLRIQYEIDAEDRYTYVPEKVSLSDMVSFMDWYIPDGTLNAFVDITYTMTNEAGNVIGTFVIPAGKSAADCRWNWLEVETYHCGKYLVHCTVTPVSEGTYNEITREKTPHAHVLYPTLSLQDSVQEIGEEPDTGLGDLPDETGFAQHFAGVDWACGCGFVPPKDTRPSLQYVTALSGKEHLEEQDGKLLIADTDDVQIRVDVCRAMPDGSVSNITSDTRFIHSCNVPECGYVADPGSYASGNVRFLIHVKQPDRQQEPPLTIEKPEESEDEPKMPEKPSDPPAGTKTPDPTPVQQTVTIKPQPVTVTVENQPAQNVSVTSSTPAVQLQTQPAAQQTVAPAIQASNTTANPAVTASATEPANSRQAVSTGDESSLAGWLGLLVTAAASLGGWAVRRRR